MRYILRKMSTTERKVRPRWLQLQDGSRIPALCWGSFYKEAYRARVSSVGALGLAVVAIGEHEADRNHVLYGGTELHTVAQALGSISSNSQAFRGIPNKEMYAKPFSRLANSPGVGVVDVVLFEKVVGATDLAVAHFGTRTAEELTESLGDYSMRLLSELNTTPPTDLVKNPV